MEFSKPEIIQLSGNQPFFLFKGSVMEKCPETLILFRGQIFGKTKKEADIFREIRSADPLCI